MRLFKGIFILFGVLIFSSCIKHEIIPAPEPKVDLPATFSALKDGTPFELIKDVDGYFCEAEQAKEIPPPPELSNIIYISSIRSNQKNDYIKISLGKLLFNADNSNSSPSLSEFKDFFKNNKTPEFKNGGNYGVDITYRDGYGNIWYSNENSADFQNFVITDLKQESDEKGDYMKFTARFNVTLVDDLDNPQNTLELTDAIYQGYFKR